MDDFENTEETFVPPEGTDPEIVEMYRLMGIAEREGTEEELIAKFKKILEEPDLNEMGHMMYEFAIAMMEITVKERNSGYHC